MSIVRVAVGFAPAAALLAASCNASGPELACRGRGPSDAGRDLDHASWMTQLTCGEPGRERTLRELCWPRSHDTGTYVESSCLFPGASNACNTKTQGLTMRGQLEAGVRAFDVRVQRISPGDYGVVEVEAPRYFTHHTVSCGSLGCIGTPLDLLLADLRDFLDHHREFVFLDLGHLCLTDAEDPSLLALIEGTLGERIYLEPTDESRPLLDRPLSALLPGDLAVGKVLVSYEGLDDTPELRRAGRFASGFVPVEGYWSNVTEVALLEADQLGHYASFANDGAGLFEFSWTLTQDNALAFACGDHPDTARSIEDMAAEANAALPGVLDDLIAGGAIRPGRMPNVLSVDFAGPWVTEECLAIISVGAP